MTQARRPAQSTSPRLTAISFVGLVFLSAVLVFSVQPLVGRMLLPVLGGSSAVWNTCLVFFQGALLAGYLYAHALTRSLSLGRQIAVHLAVLAVALPLLPIAFGSLAPPADSNPSIWLLGQLIVEVGVPYTVVSASAPLFQSWFARTTHPDAEDPYFLYAASNLGSILALAAYPFAVEPNLALAAQSSAWAILFGVLIAGVAWVGYRTWVESSVSGLREPFRGERAAEAARPPLRRYAWWTLCAFVPSALLVSVTAHITTDIAPVPLLWMIPLVLYLLSYVIAFARWQPVPPAVVIGIALPLLVATAILTSTEPPWIVSQLSIIQHGLAFFAAAIAFHMLLAKTRPAADFLTSFYLVTSLGGVLGGAFVALLAPELFDGMTEYPLLMVLAAALLALEGELGERGARTQWVVSIVVAGCVAGPLWYVYDYYGTATVLRGIGLLAALLLGYWSVRRSTAFSIALALLMLSHGWLAHIAKGVVYEERGHFGRLVVVEENGRRILKHGRVEHGSEFLPSTGRSGPTSYYHRASGVGHAFAELASRPGQKRVAAVGLGVGTLAAYAREDVIIDFYEIDPLVVDIAQNVELFTFLDRCGEQCNVIVGDARLELLDAPDGGYDMIVEDAFSGDAVPTHLLTREAMQLYLRKLAPGGLLLFHVSNKHLHLVGITEALAKDAGLEILVHLARPRDGVSPTWTIVARERSAFGTILEAPGTYSEWKSPNLRVWTDDYSDILSAYIF